MDYRRIAYGSFYDIKGRLWGINLLRRTDSVMAARELTFEGDEAAVVEWDEFDLEKPIQGSALTLRIISEADREWTSLYTVDDGDVVAEVTLEGGLWWRGSLDPETYEEPYERAQDYTVELRFSDFGPLKRHRFTLPGDGGLIKTGEALGVNLLTVGSVTALSSDGLPSNADISSITPPEGQSAADMLAIGAGEDAFREDTDSTDPIKAWDALEALLTASGLRMTQRAGKIMLYNLKGIRDNAGSKAEECVWSGDSQTLGADRIASRVVVSHSGDGDGNLIRELKTGREQDERVLGLSYGYGPDDQFNSFSLTLFETSTWERPENAWGFFSIRAGLDNVASAEGWMMWAYRNNRENSPFSTAIKNYPYYSGPQTDGVDSPSVATSPKTYIHLTDSPGAFNRPQTGFLIKVEQEMLFDCRYNPFANDGNGDVLQKTQDTYAKTQLVYVLAQLTVETASGKKYWWTNADKINSATSESNLFASHSFDSGKWSETKAPYWIQYRTKEKRENGQIVGAGWTVNKPFVSVPSSIKWKNLKYNVYTQKLPDGDLIPLPPERGWLSLEVFATVRFIGDGISGNAPLGAMRWILGKGARISIVDANSNFEMPEGSESEIRVICNNGAEDDTDLSPILGSGGGYLGCRSLIINADGSVAEKGVPELRTASEIASQLCMRRTRLTGEAYINTSAPLSFTERLQTGRVFMLVSERIDLQKGFGDRVITELLRTDIDGLEVRRNERVVFSATTDRGGRDGKDAEVYSIIPTATAVSVKSSTITDADGNVKVATEYVPAELGCSVYLTVGNDMAKTRDGILKRKITDANGNTISNVIVETDGGEAAPVAVPKGSASIEFKLLSDDTDDAMTLAICTIPVDGGSILFPDYDQKKDTLNFRNLLGDFYLKDSIDLSKYKDVSISTGTGLTGGGTLEEDRTLSLDESGVDAGTYTKITVDKYGRATKGDYLLASDIPTLAISKISGLQTALDAKLEKTVFTELFEKVNIGTASAPIYAIKAKLGLYTDQFLSARGLNGEQAEVSAGLDKTQLAKYLSDYGYATQLWVGGRGFLTSSALTGYATQDWVKNQNYLTSHQSLANYVTLNTAQTIAGIKTFTSYAKHESLLMFKASNATKGIYLSPSESGALNFSTHENYGWKSTFGSIDLNGNLKMQAFVKDGGTNSQALMADGSVRTVNLLNSITNLGWSGTSGQLATINTLAYWNGQYSSGSSNLQYCDRGRFGTMATATATDYLARSGGSMTNTNVVTNLNADLLDGLHASSFPRVVQGNTNTTGTKYVLLGTLPTSTAQTFDTFNIRGSIGGFGSATKYLIDIEVGNRDGVNFRGFLSGKDANVWDIGVNAAKQVFLILKSQYTAYNLTIHAHQSSVSFSTSTTPTDTTFTLLSASTAINVFNNGSFTGNAGSATKLQTSRTLWGQSFDGTANVSGNMTGVGEVYATGWFRTYGSRGWYNEDYKGGIYMTDSNWIRTYGNKALLVDVSNANSWGIGGHRLNALFQGLAHASILLRVTDNSVAYGIAANTNGNMYFGKRTNGTVDSHTNDAYLMVLNSTGLYIGGGSNPAYRLDVNGVIRANNEIISASANAFRMVYGNYGVFFRNDGANTYLLLTASGDQYGAYNTLRPFSVNNSTGLVSMSNGLSVNKITIGSCTITYENGGLRFSKGIYSEEFVSARGYNGNASDVTGGLAWSEIKAELDKNGYATQSWVGGRGFLTSSALTGYATQDWVKNQNYLTSHQSLANYYTKADADNRYVKKAGDTMTGVLHLLANQFPDTANTGALNLNNSDIYGVNSIKFADLCDAAAEGLQWYRDATHIDSFWVKNGTMYFTPNRTWGGTGTNNVVWHAGNDGSGSGLDADMLDGLHASSFPRVVQGTTMTTGTKYVLLGTLPTSSDQTFDTFNIRGSIGGFGSATKYLIDIEVGNRDGVNFRGFLSGKDANAWDIGVNAAKQVFLILKSLYTAYNLTIHAHQSSISFSTSTTPTDTTFTLLSASTAINVFNNGSFTGNAGSATKLQTARTLWGQSFDGTANVSGNMTGVGNISTTPANGRFIACNGSDHEWGLHMGSGGENRGIYEWTTGFDKWLLYFNNKYTILNHGNVGIGTASPGHALDVNGQIRAQGGWLRTTGNNGWYNETYGGGWYMSDTAWVRTYNAKSIYAGGGIIRTDGQLQVGGDGEKFLVNKDGDCTLAGRITSSKATNTFLAGNQGNAIINSTADAGAYTMLAKLNSSNGYFTMGSYGQQFKLYYTVKSTVDAGKNEVTKSVMLLSEGGATTLNELTVGSESFHVAAGGDSAFGTTFTLANSVLFRKSLVVAGVNFFFTSAANGTGEGLWFTPEGTYNNKKYLGLMKHTNRSWTADCCRFFFDGTFWAKTGIYSDGYVSARGQNTSSDERLKQCLTPFEIALRQIAEAPSVGFSWKKDGSRDVGSIAQYWKGINPLLTPEDNDGFLTLQYGKTALLASITIARKTLEHEGRIARLERENKELKRKIEILERR